MKEEYKIDFLPLLEERSGVNYSKSMNPEEKVNYLVQNLRLTINNHKFLHDMTASNTLDYKSFPFLKNEYDINKDNFKGEGAAIVDLLRRLNEEKEGISFEKYDLKDLSGFFQDDQSELKNKLKQNAHCISIVTIDDKKYIIDCAYRQFFPSQDEKQEQDSERVDLSSLCLNDEKRKNVAEHVLKYGFVEATPGNLKIYMDTFIEAIAKDKNIKFPSEEDYIEKIKGKTITGDLPTKQITEQCNINQGLRQYYFEKRKEEQNSDKKNNYMKICNSLVSYHPRGFSIIEKDGKEYIKGNIGGLQGVEDKRLDEQLRKKIYLILAKVQRGEIEFTEKNLKLYIDAFLILVSGDINIERPTIEQYNDILEIDKFKKYGAVTDTYIIDSEPYIINDYQYDQFDEKMSAEEKLTSIVQKERHLLMNGRNLMAESLIGDCEDSTARVSFDCASKGFTDTHYLFPGFYLDEGAIGHNCTITTLDGKSYLIDCTYRQFFIKDNKEYPRYVYDS